MITIDDLIAKIADATNSGDWRQVQLIAKQLHLLVHGEGRSINAGSAADLVEALANGTVLGAHALGGADTDFALSELDGLLKAEPMNRTAVQTSWDTLYRLLADPTVVVEKARLKSTMEIFRSKRLFDYLAKTADRAITRFPDDLAIKRLNAQALIDQGQVHAAITVLEGEAAACKLAASQSGADAQMSKEYSEITGLLGRSYKQIYVDNVTSPHAPPAALATFKLHLRKAIENYCLLYDPHQPGKNYWHGINLAALLRLAKTDGHAGLLMPYPAISAADQTPESLAHGIIRALEAKPDTAADAWALATLAEAYLIAGDREKAVKYVGEYVRAGADTFMITATVRQFEEVLRISADDAQSAEILAILKARQISMSEGRFTLNGDSLRQQQKVAESKSYQRLHEQVFQETMTEGSQFVPLETLAKVVDRAAAVAAVTDERGKTWGTGFLVKGEDLRRGWGDDIFMITNAHVLSCEKMLSEHTPQSPLRPTTARAVMEAGGGALTLHNCAEFQRNPATLDVTIIRVNCDKSKVKTLQLYPAGKNLVPEDPDHPTTSNSSKVSVIGCPLGGPLSLSLVGDLQGANGVLIDIGGRNSADEKDPLFLHYRAPTEPGNSGSPVFETTDWTVVGLHHQGYDKMAGRPRLNGAKGVNYGNEGISIRSICRAIEKM